MSMKLNYTGTHLNIWTITACLNLDFEDRIEATAVMTRLYPICCLWIHSELIFGALITSSMFTRLIFLSQITSPWFLVLWRVILTHLLYMYLSLNSRLSIIPICVVSLSCLAAMKELLVHSYSRHQIPYWKIAAWIPWNLTQIIVLWHSVLYIQMLFSGALQRSLCEMLGFVLEIEKLFELLKCLKLFRTDLLTRFNTSQHRRQKGASVTNYYSPSHFEQHCCEH